jgi:hypothetical protein
MSYETRLLRYADILGWTTELSTGDDSKAHAAMEGIHAASRFHGEYAHQESIRCVASRKFRANPLYLGVQCGEFSDILHNASDATRRLLQLSSLTRGAVVTKMRAKISKMR